MSKEIALTRGFIAIVDDWNYEALCSYRWYERSGYAVCAMPRAEGRRLHVYMHRFILGLELGDSRQVDHVNHERLDNREGNLRVCSLGENLHNQLPQKRSTSSFFKGVSWHKYNRSWSAQIHFEGKTVHLGNFSVEEEAARAYDDAALEFFGLFACTNSSLGLFS